MNDYLILNKVKSYIGFAIKSKKVVVGQTVIKKSKEQLHLIICCNSATNNLKSLAKNVANKFNCVSIVVDDL